MFSNYIHRFLFWILIFKIVPSYAQDTTALYAKLPEVWNLQACLEYAKANNITLNSYRLNRLSSQQDLELSRAAVLPNLSVSASPSLINSKTVDPVTGELQSGVRFSGSSALNSSVILYDGGYLKNDIQQKDLLVKIAGLDVATIENDITLQITQAYLNVLLAKENIVYVRDVVATSTA